MLLPSHENSLQAETDRAGVHAIDARPASTDLITVLESQAVHIAASAAELRSRGGRDRAALQRLALRSRLLLRQCHRLLAQVDRADGPATAGPRAISPRIRSVQDFIDRGFQSPITQDDCARVARCSRTHLAKIFHDEVGTTLHRYLTSRRMRAAAPLIRGGEKIEAVSLLVGYRCKRNFYRQFLLYTGHTPSAYRALEASTTQEPERVALPAVVNGSASPAG